MSWINIKKIPSDKEFLNIITGLVLNCPSCEEKKCQNGTNEEGKIRYKYEYKPVSVRNTSFRSRGIFGNMFTTLLIKIRKPLVNNGAYELITDASSVETKVNSILASTALGDQYFDFVVYQRKQGMADIEALYYYIRNAFAHGSFEVINTKTGRVYKLESAKGENIKAQMRLKECTLKEYIEYSMYTPADIKMLQKSKKK